MNRKLLALFGLLMIVAFLVPTAVNAGIGMNERGKPAARYCSITAPGDGVTVSGVVTIAVDASGTPTITIDGAVVAEAYSYDWDSTAVADGSHTIGANFKNANDAVTVTVANGGDPPPPPPPPPEGNKLALVIGISDYEGTGSDLTYCDEDAVDWKNYLQGEGYSVTMLLDQQATAANIVAALEDLAAAEQAGDYVAVTYSGHGYYDRSIRQSGWISHDLYLMNSDYIETITDTFESTAVFWFNDCCNIGTYERLANNGWVVGMGSNTRTYTYDGTSDMQNGIYTYYAMEGIALGYYTAEDIISYANQMFNAATPGKAYIVDNFTGELDI